MSKQRFTMSEGSRCLSGCLVYEVNEVENSNYRKSASWRSPPTAPHFIGSRPYTPSLLLMLPLSVYMPSSLKSMAAPPCKSWIELTLQHFHTIDNQPAPSCIIFQICNASTSLRCQCMCPYLGQGAPNYLPANSRGDLVR